MKRRGFLNYLGASYLAVNLNDRAAAQIGMDSSSHYLQGRTVLITGATSGIGREAAEALAKLGAKVAFCGRREGLGREVQSVISKRGGQALYVKADVRKEKEVDNFLNLAIEKMKRVDFVFLNAGPAGRSAYLHQVTNENIEEAFETHFLGSLYVMRRLLPIMMNQKSGVFVANTTYGINRALPGAAIYAASKMAIRPLIEHIASDYINYGIRAHSIEPLAVLTDPIRRKAELLGLPISKLVNPHSGRFAEASEIAKVLEFLFSDAAKLLNGHHLRLDEGASIPHRWGKRVFNFRGF